MTSPSDLPEYRGTEVLTIRPGDRVVLVAREKVTPRALQDVLKAWRNIWPDIPVIAVNGVDVVVLREETE